MLDDLVAIKDKFCMPVEERALLSLSIKDTSTFYHISSKVTEDDFIYPDDSHRILYLILRSLIDKGVEKFDLPLVVSAAERNGVLHAVGGFEYLQTIGGMRVSSENTESYLKAVLEASTKYNLYLKLKDNLSKVLVSSDGSVDSGSLIGSIEQDVLNLSSDSKALSEPKNFSDGLCDLIEQRRVEYVPLRGLSTGFPILDMQINGLIDGTLFVVAARKKMGKSTFLSNVAAHVAFREKIPVLYVDTEMPFDQWRDRIIARVSGIKEREVIAGGYTEEAYRKIKKCEALAEKVKLFHEYMPSYNVGKLVSLYKKFKFKHNIGLMVFDYLKEPESTSYEKNRQEHQILGDVTTALKDLAGNLKIPAITAVQLNRNNDVADSDKISRYADVVAYWMSRDKKDKELSERAGSHKLVIKDTRRGGRTSESGIGYWFYKESLEIKEVIAADQVIPEFMEGKLTNYESASGSAPYKQEEDSYVDFKDELY